MAARRIGVKSIGTQLELYRSGNVELVRESVQWRTAEEIQEQNRAALLQPFVVKKHRASRLHYDFRLGWNGVLKSWAMPAGPSDCVGVRSEAIQVEDHRREYMGFEGMIPEDRYGSGPVMLWDSGMWRPHSESFDVDAGLRNGHLRFTLHGAKLKGDWTLVLKQGTRRPDQRPVWELIKESDSFARSGPAISILEEAPNSVSTGRTLGEIERDWSKRKSEDPSAPTLFDI